MRVMRSIGLGSIALAAIVAAMAFASCTGPAGPQGPSGADNLPVVTNINSMYADGGVATQDFKNAVSLGAPGVKFYGWHGDVGTNATAVIDNTAANDGKALHMISTGAAKTGFYANTFFTDIYDLGWYKVVASYKFPAASTTGGTVDVGFAPAQELNTGASDATAGNFDTTSLAIPAAAQTTFSTFTEYIQITAGYSAVKWTVWGDAANLIFQSVTIQKVSSGPITAATATAGITATYSAVTPVDGTATTFSFANWDAGAVTPTASAAGLKIATIAKWGPWSLIPDGKGAPLPAGTYTVSFTKGAATDAGETLTFAGTAIPVTAGAGVQTLTGIVVPKYTALQVVGNAGGAANAVGTLELTDITVTRTGN
jgi:hypothetical protein